MKKEISRLRRFGLLLLLGLGFSSRPGIGAEIRPELFKTGDAIVETVARVSE